MRKKNSKQLYEYWSRIKGDRPAPRRDEIEPSDIRNLLSDTFILEVSGTLRTVSYRLAGTRLCAAFGRELKGYGFLGHWAETDCFDVAKQLARVYRESQPLVMAVLAETASGKTMEYEILVLPLEPMQDGTARILGIATAAKMEYWLGAEPLVECKLRYARALSETKVSRVDAPALAPSLLPVSHLDGEGTPSREDTSRTNTSRKVAHLVVHDGGRE